MNIREEASFKSLQQEKETWKVIQDDLRAKPRFGIHIFYFLLEYNIHTVKYTNLRHAAQCILHLYSPPVKRETSRTHSTSQKGSWYPLEGNAHTKVTILTFMRLDVLRFLKTLLDFDFFRF